MLSPSLFCVYMDPLLGKLRNSGLGCHIGGLYFGAFSYADDIILLTTSRESLQLMLKICEEYAKEYSMKYSTDPDPKKSKTKCLHFTKKKKDIPKVILNNDPLPWVPKADHLGNTLSVNLNTSPVSVDASCDLLQKRAIFFDRVHQHIQRYGYCDPRLVCELIKIFGTSFYGSVLWQLDCKEHEQLNRSWNTTIKMVFKLPYSCHTRFLESLTEIPHLQSVVHSRYVGFLKKVGDSKEPILKFLFALLKDDKTSNTGRNVDFLKKKYDFCDIQELFQKKHDIKHTRVYELTEEEFWKPKIIEELSLMKLGLLESHLNEDEIEVLLEDICST